LSQKIIYNDAICFVLSAKRTKEAVYSVLNEFIPGYKTIEGDYAFNSTSNLTFIDEDEILTYLENNETERGAIDWNKKQNNPNGIMVGAHFTTDSHLIMSLTVSGDGSKEGKYLELLKSILNSTIGVIYYNLFPGFKDGEDFKRRYK